MDWKRLAGRIAAERGQLSPVGDRQVHRSQLGEFAAGQVFPPVTEQCLCRRVQIVDASIATDRQQWRRRKLAELTGVVPLVLGEF